MAKKKTKKKPQKKPAKKLIKKKPQKKNQKNKTNLFLLAAILLGIAVLTLSVIEFIDFDKLKLDSDQLFIKIKDECSYMNGIGLVHQIRDEDDCSINCNNRCKMEDSKRERINFTMINNDCNICDCYCE